MKSHRARIALAAAAMTATAATLVSTTGATAATAPPQGTTTTAPTARVVILPTGDRVTVTTAADGRKHYAMDPVAGASTAFATYDNGAGDHYVVPSEAVPYAGRLLNLSLFDVSKLAAAPASANGQIPVSLTFAAGVTPAAPPGVTFTSVSGATATGYLDPASGPAFAAALRTQIGADVAAGHRAGSGALFGGLTSMTPLNAPLPPVTPHYPLHFLQLNATDDTGAPAAFAPITVLNTDSAAVYHANPVAYDGIARLAVPAGNYAAYMLQFSFDAQGNAPKGELVALDDFTVPSTAGVTTTVTLDARTATSQVSVTTPQPATEDGEQLNLLRQTAAGGVGGIGIGDFGGGLTLYASPTAPVQIGKFASNFQWYGAGPASASPYRYDLSFTSDHIAADQGHAVTASGLATVTHTFASDPSYGSALPSFLKGTVLPFGGWSIMGGPTPLGAVTEYVTPGDEWQYEYSEPFNWTPGQPFMPPPFFQNDSVAFAAGQSVSRDWAKGPLAPKFGRHTADTTNFFGCQACTGNGNLSFVLSPVSDSSPDTTGLDFGETGNITVFWDGQQVTAGAGFGALLTGIPSGPATVRAVLDTDRSSTGVTQTTKTHTDVTFPYSGQADPASALPSGLFCYAAFPTTGPCQILPVLTVDYHLTALDDRNTSHAPVQNLVLDVGHLSYGTQGSQAQVTSAQVSVSFDKGATWQDVQTNGANGHYAAHWQNPASPAGASPMLRVTATDALGGSITQTTTDAYTVAPR